MSYRPTSNQTQHYNSDLSDEDALRLALEASLAESTRAADPCQHVRLACSRSVRVASSIANCVETNEIARSVSANCCITLRSPEGVSTAEHRLVVQADTERAVEEAVTALKRQIADLEEQVREAEDRAQQQAEDARRRRKQFAPSAVQPTGRVAPDPCASLHPRGAARQAAASRSDDELRGILGSLGCVLTIYHTESPSRIHPHALPPREPPPPPPPPRATTTLQQAGRMPLPRATASPPLAPVARGGSPPLLRGARRHVFVDNSNIFIGAQAAHGGDPAVRISPEDIARLLRPNGAAVVVGSKPPASDGIWHRWEAAGFRTKVCARDESGHEDTIDDFLHAQIFDALLDPSNAPSSSTLVLVTGDGNANSGWATFPKAVRRAAERGWQVEVWSWRHCRSAEYSRLAAAFAKVVLCDLDDYDEITYRAGR